LIRAGERLAATRGAHTVEIASYKDSPRATALYERLGYRIVGEEPDDWEETKPDGTVVLHDDPCWVMRRPLGGS